MQKIFTRLLALMVMVLLAAGNAKAIPFPQDGSPITSGTVYDVKAFQDYEATFTPSASGIVIQDGCPALQLIDAGTPEFSGYSTFGQVYTWHVEGGKTYAIKSVGFVMDNGQVSFTEEKEVGVEVHNLLPAAGDLLFANANSTGEVMILFNTAVTIESATLSAGSQSIEIVNVSMQPLYVNLAITDAMNALYASGALSREGGETVTIDIYGLKSSGGILYNGDGKYSVSYIAAPKLTDMVSTNMPSMLKSYYPAGDPQGIWTYVFDRNLMNDGSIYMTIECGNPMSEDMFYHEVLYPLVDGATLTFDLTDKKRELNDYLTFQDAPQVPIKINNVRDIYGNPTAGLGQGNVSSYGFSLDFDYIKPQNVVCEFTPASGSSLKGVDEIEIWYNNADLILFDGVNFNYMDTDGSFKDVIVLKDELSAVLEGKDMTINVKIPDVVKGKDQVTVSLYNQRSLDGNTYRIIGLYDMFIVSLLGPIHNGEKIASTGDQDFTFSIKATETVSYFYYRYDFYNAAPSAESTGWAYGSELTQQPNGTWTAYNPNIPCYTDFNPYMVVSAYYTSNDWEMGSPAAKTYEFHFVGSDTPFAYSDVKFVSIDPEPDTAITPEEDFYFTVVWDGLVKVDAATSGIMRGMGAGIQPFEKVEPIYTEEEYLDGYSSIWHLYPGMSAFEDKEFLDITIFAKDEAGNVVEGNMGSFEVDYLWFGYPIRSEANYLELTINPEPNTHVDKLEALTLSYPGKDVSINYSYTDDVNIRILNSEWSIIGEYGHDALTATTNAEGIQELVLNVTPVTAAGSYMLMIPENYLLIGDQFDVSGNASVFVEYVVDGAETPSTESVELLAPIKAGDVIASTGDEDFVFSISNADAYYRYDFYNASEDSNNGGWAYGTDITRKEDGTWTAFNPNIPCYNNFQPYMLVRAYAEESDFWYGVEPLASYTFTFTGTQEPFEYSPVKLVSVDPEPNSTITLSEDFCITLTYDGLVKVNTETSGIMVGFGGGVAPFEKVVAVDEVSGYASTWSIYPGESALIGVDWFDVAIYVTDQNGKVVEGNLDAEADDYLWLGYAVYQESNFLDLTVTPEQWSVVDKLDSFTFSYPGKDVSINYSYTDDVNIRVLDMFWTIVAEYGHDALSAVVGDDGVQSLVLNIDPITKDGMYMLMIPENYLLIGDQFDVHGNAAVFADYTVDPTTAISSVTDDAKDNKVYNVLGMPVKAENLRPGMYIINGQKVYIK